MNKKLIGYWLLTGMVVLVFGAGGVMDLLQPEQVVQTMEHLGYPLYFASMLGTYKIAGTLIVLAPRLPRLKEWAYAGFVFDLVSAAWSHQASGDSFDQVALPLFLIAVVMGSYVLRPASRRVGVSEVDEAEGE